MSTIIREQPRPRRRFFFGAAVVLLVLIALGVWAYFATRPRPATVVRRDIVGLEFLNGEIVTPPSARADVFTAYKAPVEKVDASIGARVSRGDILVELSFPSVEAAVQQAQAGVKAAETAYANARLQYDRAVTSAQKQLDAARAAEKAGTGNASPSSEPEGTGQETTPPTDAGQPSANRQEAEQTLQQAQQNRDIGLASYRQQLDSARETYQQAMSGAKAAFLRAPISGTVLALNAQPGQPVPNDGKTPVATIVDLDALQVQATMTPEQTGYIRTRMPVLLAFADIPNRQFEGRVSRITSQIASGVAGLIKEQRYVAIIEFRNADDAVRPGMKPNVAVKTGEAKNALAVPNEALETDASGRPIVRMLSNGQWLPIAVQPGLSDGRYTEIKSGLQQGEIVQVIPNLLHAASPSRRP
jgi:HlyD family secretion protein